MAQLSKFQMAVAFKFKGGGGQFYKEISKFAFSIILKIVKNNFKIWTFAIKSLVEHLQSKVKLNSKEVVGKSWKFVINLFRNQWVGGRMAWGKSRFKDCLQQSKMAKASKKKCQAGQPGIWFWYFWISEVQFLDIFCNSQSPNWVDKICRLFIWQFLNDVQIRCPINYLQN